VIWILSSLSDISCDTLLPNLEKSPPKPFFFGLEASVAVAGALTASGPTDVEAAAGAAGIGFDAASGRVDAGAGVGATFAVGAGDTAAGATFADTSLIDAGLLATGKVDAVAAGPVLDIGFPTAAEF